MGKDTSTSGNTDKDAGNPDKATAENTGNRNTSGNCTVINITCEVPIYDGCGHPEVLENWIIDMEAWFGYKEETVDLKKVQFAKLKLTGLAKLLVTNCVPEIDTWNGLKDALRKAFQPAGYLQDMKINWLRLRQGFNMPVQEYIHQFNRLRILLKIPEGQVVDGETELATKFKSGLLEHLYLELKYQTNIKNIIDAYKYAQLAEDKFLDQCRVQQQCSKSTPPSSSTKLNAVV